MSKTKVHVIPHTHWDREWYFNSSRSTIYLVKHFKEVLDYLEENEKFKSYLMDAQSSLVEDYLKFCPEDEERIKKLVKQKRLFIGPWYTQTDQLVISQESIVRNLLYGSRIANNLGGYFNIAYAPDIFGQGGNMPQIYKEFGMNRFLFWRGISDNTSSKTEFIWQGDDGTTILSKQIREGYYNCGHLYEDEKDIIENLDLKMKDLENKSNTNVLYFANGFDQAPIRKNLLDILEKYNKLDTKREYFISTPEEYFDDLEKNLKDIELPLLKGELTEAKHSRIHKSIFSTRADLKQLNNENENLLVNVLEPILCISHSLGNRYPQKEIEKVWKLLFENAAHDSIGQCNGDDTNSDIYYRHKLAKDYINNLLDLNMRLVSSKIVTDKEYQFTLFNPYPEKRDEIVKIKAYISDENFEIKDYENNTLDYVILNKVDQSDYVLNQQIKLNLSKKTYKPEKVYLSEILVYVKNIPALGYKAIYLDLNTSKKQIFYKENEDKIIENKNYKIVLEDDNTLTILDKKNLKEYRNQMIFEENGDDGDSYNYSPPRNDKIITSKEAKLVYFKKLNSNISQKFIIRLKNKLPYNLEERAEGICSKDYYYNIEVELRTNEEIIRFNVNFENTVLSHRFCVVFDSYIASKFSIADQILGIVKRKVYLDTMKVWEKEKWQEIPNCIEGMQSFVTLDSKENGIALITQGVREYEIVGKNYSKIRLTLFRTFGFMGKDNLLYRPGRASGESIIKTPDAQLLGDIKCSFALYLYQGEYNNFNIPKISKMYLSPIQSYQFSDFLNGRLIFCYRDEKREFPTEYSLKEYNEDAIVSCIKKAEDNNNYIIRYFNPFLNKNVTIKNKFTKALKLDESEKELEYELSNCKYITYIIN